MIRALLKVIAVLCILGLAVPLISCRSETEPYLPLKSRPPVKSTDLKGTLITAHMEQPIPPETNVVYCSTFQLAWNLFQDDLIKEPIKLSGDPPIADHLNKQLSKASDISKDCYVAMWDELTPAFVQRINKALKKKFGDSGPPEVKEENPGIPTFMAYAYLQKDLRFPEEFETCKSPLTFYLSNERNKGTEVRAFWIPEWMDNKRKQRALRKQVLVIEYSDHDNFIVSLKTTRRKDEIILAKMKPKKTLRDTIAAVDSVVKTAKATSFEEGDVLIIPRIDFFINHTFSELEGRHVLNKGWGDWFVSKAIQWIRFRLDERGAVLKSEARIDISMNGGRDFYFDCPFLIYFKEKGGEYPYFAMWVGNAELLEKKEESKNGSAKTPAPKEHE